MPRGTKERGSLFKEEELICPPGKLVVFTSRLFLKKVIRKNWSNGQTCAFLSPRGQGTFPQETPARVRYACSWCSSRWKSLSQLLDQSSDHCKKNDEIQIGSEDILLWRVLNIEIFTRSYLETWDLTLNHFHSRSNCTLGRFFRDGSFGRDFKYSWMTAFADTLELGSPSCKELNEKNLVW